jgi:glutamate---cysteine ligase / carboxylate-amine ligase
VSTLSLFEAVGVELEYMIVDSKRLNVRTIADRLLVDRDGDPVPDLEFGPIAWSNELVNHVVEFKTNGPAKTLDGLDEAFQQNVTAANKRLATFGARLMPTAMHPWMDPNREKQLWLGESAEIYKTFDTIFDCSGHGWANLQSTHINLPFSGDDEFGRLHAAIRILLPLLPGFVPHS